MAVLPTPPPRSTTLGSTTPGAGSDAPDAPLPRAGLLLVSVGAALLLSMHAISGLSGQVLAIDRQAYSFERLMGPGRLLSWDSTGWQVPYGTIERAQIAAFLVPYLALDLLFIAGYLIIGWRVAGPALRWAVLVTAVADVLENALAAAVRMPSGGPATALAPWVTAATVLKWTGVLVIVIGLLDRVIRPLADGRVRRVVGRRRRALWNVRYSIAAALPIAVLSVLPGSAVLNQLPDVQRRWVEDGQGVLHAAAAVPALGLLVASIFVLGRLQAGWMERRRSEHDPDDRQEPVLWPWLLPLLALPVALVAHLTGGVVLGDHLFWFVGIPLVIAGSSWTLTRLAAQRPRLQDRLRPRPTTPPTAAGVRTTVRFADGVAVLAATLLGLGLIRSMTAPAVLAVTSPWALPAADRRELDLSSGAWSAVLWALGMIAVAVPTWYGPQLIARWSALAVRLDLPRGRRGANRLDLLTAGLLTAGLLTLAVLGIAPLVVAEWLGVVAVLALAVTALVAIIGVTGGYLQDQPAPAFLRLLHFRRTPLLLVLGAAALVANLMTGDPDVHGVRGTSAGSPGRPERPGQGAPPVRDQRATIEASFAEWLALPNNCGTLRLDLPGTGTAREVRIRPMVLVAAEGGGVRAAYWTATATAALTAGGPADCARQAVFLSSGASGGAVGLTLSSVAAEPKQAAVRLARPTALAAGGLGLLIRDVGYSVTGIPLPVIGSDDVLRVSDPDDPRPQRWRDRAALMEHAWEAEVPELAERFVRPPGPAAARPANGSWPSTGRLVLNGTAVDSGCRALISQLRLGPGPRDTNCEGTTSPAAYSFDLLATFSPDRPGAAPTPGASRERCATELRASTAAMLAARFPVVTPSGVVGPCWRQPSEQIVDGGYTDNSALGTQLDLAHEWLPLVRRHNDAVLDGLRPGGVPSGGAGPTEPRQIVVPMMVWLTSGSGTDVAPAPGAATAELLVPLVAYLQGRPAQGAVPALLQRSALLVGDHALCTQPAQDADPFAAAACRSLREAVDTGSVRVAIVYPVTRPSAAVPLGWTLSAASMQTMDRALAAQLRGRCTAAPHERPAWPLVCGQGYLSLGDVRKALGGN